jgi:hypothetical protein
MPDHASITERSLHLWLPDARLFSLFPIVCFKTSPQSATQSISLSAHSEVWVNIHQNVLLLFKKRLVNTNVLSNALLLASKYRSSKNLPKSLRVWVRNGKESTLSNVR